MNSALQRGPPHARERIRRPLVNQPRRHAGEASVTNVEFRLGTIEDLPVEDAALPAPYGSSLPRAWPPASTSRPPGPLHLLASGQVTSHEYRP